ncbi:MAG: hypothetical protein WD423_09430 [Rhodothermales bacterium]
MEKATLLVVTGLILAAASYQVVATDSLADANRTTLGDQIEIATRNAAFGAFTEAKRLVEDSESFEAFLPPGVQLTGDYEGATYEARIISSGESVTIHSSASTNSGVDTVDFSVSAQVVWAFDPSLKVGGADARYLVLKAYHEE